jgi:hypothetical protein
MVQMLDYNDADGGGEQADAAADDAAALQQAAEAAAGAVKAEEAGDSAAGAGGDATQTTTEVRRITHFFGVQRCTAGMCCADMLLGATGSSELWGCYCSVILSTLLQAHSVAAAAAGGNATADPLDPLSQPPHGTEVRADVPSRTICLLCCASAYVSSWKQQFILISRFRAADAQAVLGCVTCLLLQASGMDAALLPFAWTVQSCRRMQLRHR